MKRLLLIATAVASSFSAYSQSLDYNDLGLIFSRDDNFGTARYEAMSGAFGALGGDISAFSINPAGSAVAKISSVGATLGNRNLSYQSNFYGNAATAENDYFNLNQAGATLTFDNTGSSEWNRFALTVNYKIKSDYDSFYLTNGKSGFLKFTEHFNDTRSPKIQFDRSLDQSYSVQQRGQLSVFNIGISAVHQNKLYLGASVNFHDLSFNRVALLKETNDDVNGNVLNASNIVDSYIQGNGLSFTIGFIYKPQKFIRLGLAYETPTWYEEITEDYRNDLSLSSVSALNINGGIDRIRNGFAYRFKTHSRVTASGALVFGKHGLLSVDYTYKDFRNIKFRENDTNFIEANQNFTTQFRGSHALSVGTEWRMDRMSIRGGYHYEKNPNLNVALGGNDNKDNIRGFSAGVGYNFGNMKIDLSYRKYENQEYQTLYNLGDINLNNTTSRITGTVTINL
ncbi:conserved exported hypothetical protein [Tenacibaculum litopenaei]|uniref:OmpP1/FadL family transporter n=1 Tax=Tenacibaculum litopenaei TaxID=396016 RepID=UPI003893CF68